MTYFSLSLSKKYNSLFFFAFTCLLFFSGCKDDAMDPNIFVKSLGGTEEFSAMDKNSFVQLENGDIVTAVNGFSPSGQAGSFESLGIHLLKMDSKGEIIWEQFFVGGKMKRCSDMIQTRDGGFLITGAQSEGEDYYDYTAIYLIKTDAEGNLLWEKTFSPGSNGIGLELAEKSNGELVLFSRIGSPLVYYLDESGNQLDAFFPTGGGRTMLLTADDKTLLASSNVALYDGNQMLWQYEFSNPNLSLVKIITDIFETPEGDFVGYGFESSYEDNSSNYFAAKISADGQLIWEKLYEEPQNNFGAAITPLPSGNYLTIGVNESSTGEAKLRLRTINPNGEELSIDLVEFSNETRSRIADMQVVNEQYIGLLGSGVIQTGTFSSITHYYQQIEIRE
jgi:hypothetical protein